MYRYLCYIEKFVIQFKTTEKKQQFTILIFEEMTIYLYGEVRL